MIYSAKKKLKKNKTPIVIMLLLIGVLIRLPLMANTDTADNINSAVSFETSISETNNLVTVNAVNTVNKTFSFKFILNKQSYTRTINSETYEKAFEKAAFDCFNHYKKKYKTLSEDDGLDIIDTCANPKSF